MKSNVLEANFDVTLSRIADAFHVNDIATYTLEKCSKNDDPQLVLDKYPEYDQIPTEQDDQIVGVLERNPRKTGAPCCMHPLDDGILVSADESLTSFLPLLAKPPFYRLVLKGTKIEGIVTKSDALKLPVRLYSFALITQLEMLMMEKIKKVFSDSSGWWDYLSNNRKELINRKCRDFKKDRMDPPLIEQTDFCDKREILRKHFHLKSEFGKNLEQIEKLRNKLAHAGKYIENEQDLCSLIDTLDKCNYWIREMPKIGNIPS